MNNELYSNLFRDSSLNLPKTHGCEVGELVTSRWWWSSMPISHAPHHGSMKSVSLLFRCHFSVNFSQKWIYSNSRNTTNIFNHLSIQEHQEDNSSLVIGIRVVKGPLPCSICMLVLFNSWMNTFSWLNELGGNYCALLLTKLLVRWRCDANASTPTSHSPSPGTLAHESSSLYPDILPSQQHWTRSWFAVLNSLRRRSAPIIIPNNETKLKGIYFYILYHDVSALKLNRIDFFIRFLLIVVTKIDTCSGLIISSCPITPSPTPITHVMVRRQFRFAEQKSNREIFKEITRRTIWTLPFWMGHSVGFDRAFVR